MLRVDFISLFPEVLWPALRHSMLGRAEQHGLVSYSIANPRDFTYDRHHKVDDSPYGGEPGMLIRPEPVALALEFLTQPKPANLAVVLTDPAGTPFSQSCAIQLCEFDHIVFLCGHYEGFDHRVKTQLASHSYSIGDYVLTNGEIPALAMCDAVVRLIPGVLGSPDSLKADCHADGLLSAPNYTRPEKWRGECVPEVLLNGNHAAIRQWRRVQSLLATKSLRPDLLCRAKLEKSDVDVLSS